MKQAARRSLRLGLLAFGAARAATGQTFGDDVAFLKQHTKVVVLTDGKTGARVATCPELQGRVMTSTTRGEAGPSFGWINRELVASGKRDPHFNPYGGEDRFWLGPEGGQFAIFFKKGDPFDLAHWYTPPAIDTEAFPVASEAGDRVSFRKPMSLRNYSGTAFELRVDRTVRLLAAAEAFKELGLTETSGLEAVAYESENRIENTGKAAWRKETGLLSVWILGMFNPTPATTVVVPFRPGAEGSLGPIVNDAYFGKVPADRLAVKEGVLFFRGDGKHRSKIGIPPRRALSVLGSYDAGGRVLTLVQFTLPDGATDYVNSMWEIQKHPFAGDAVNSYNDGPAGPGTQGLGPFYELESSSPALPLRPGASYTHIHSTFHFQGPHEELDKIAVRALGVNLFQINTAFVK